MSESGMVTYTLSFWCPAYSAKVGNGQHLDCKRQNWLKIERAFITKILMKICFLIFCARSLFR